MQGSVKPSTIGIILGIIIVIFITNQWMSKEISRPPAGTQTAAPTEDETPAASQALNVPEMLQEDAPVEQQAKSAPNAYVQENQPVLEPIYDPPANSVILVQ